MEEHWPYRRHKRPPRMQMWVDGKYVFEDDAYFNLREWRSALQMGFSVLFRAYGCEVRFFNKYYEHLLRCLHLSHFPAVVYLNAAFLRERANELLQKNRYHKNALLRLTCFLHESPYELQAIMAPEPSLLLEAFPSNTQYFDKSIAAVGVSSYMQYRVVASPLSSLAWVSNPLRWHASQYARLRGYTDVLLYNQEDVPLQTTERDLYLIRGDEVLTPAHDLGLVYDPFREIVELLVRQLGYRFQECTLSTADILSADEIFLGSTAYGIEPVKWLDTKYPHNSRIKKFFEPLNILFFPEHFG